jgi:hypothetical protein
MPITIYVKLRNEGTDVRRPVEAEPVAANLYRLLGHPVEDEDWPVAQNEIVECERRMLSGGDVGSLRRIRTLTNAS